MNKDNSEYLIERRDNVYEVVIGLEVHAQVHQIQNYFRLHQLPLVQNLIRK